MRSSRWRFTRREQIMYPEHTVWPAEDFKPSPRPIGQDLLSCNLSLPAYMSVRSSVFNWRIDLVRKIGNACPIDSPGNTVSASSRPCTIAARPDMSSPKIKIVIINFGSDAPGQHTIRSQSHLRSASERTGRTTHQHDSTVPIYSLIRSYATESTS